jgi:hypothetical protein
MTTMTDAQHFLNFHSDKRTVYPTTEIILATRERESDRKENESALDGRFWLRFDRTEPLLWPDGFDRADDVLAS